MVKLNFGLLIFYLNFANLKNLNWLLLLLFNINKYKKIWNELINSRISIKLKSLNWIKHNFLKIKHSACGTLAWSAPKFWPRLLKWRYRSTRGCHRLNGAPWALSSCSFFRLRTEISAQGLHHICRSCKYGMVHSYGFWMVWQLANFKIKYFNLKKKIFLIKIKPVESVRLFNNLV